MAVNRYDSPIDAQFANTYVPIPFEQMMQAGAMKQQRFDQTAAGMDQTVSGIESINTIPNSVDEQKKNQAIRSIYSIRDKYAGKDLSDSIIVRQLNNEINSAVKAADVDQWEKSYSGYVNYKKQEGLMRSRGQNVYGGTDFTNYDSRQTGVFTDLPIMDLGAQADAAIDKFLKRPGLTALDEVMLPSGRMTLRRSRDVNEILNLIQSESGDLTNNPAIQQLMEREGMDEGAFKEFLTNLAPSYIGGDFSSPYDISGDRGNGNIPNQVNSFSNRVSPNAEVNQVTLKDVNTNRNVSKRTLDDEQETLKNMRAGEGIFADATPEDIKAQEKVVRLQKADVNELERKYNIATGVYESDFKYDSKKTKLDNEFISDFGDFTEDEARKAMSIIEQRGNYEALLLEGSTKEEAKKEVFGEGKGFGDDIEQYVANLTEGRIGRYGVAMGKLENYERQVAKLNTEHRKGLKDVIDKSPQFQTSTVENRVTYRQQKSTDGYKTFMGYDGKTYDSFIKASVTDNFLDSPDAWKWESADKKLNKDDINSILEKAGDPKKGVSLTLTGHRELPSADDGEIELFYKVKRIGKTDAEIIVKTNHPTQVDNLAKDLIRMGDLDAASTLRARMLVPEVAANRKSELESYEIYYQDSTSPTGMDSGEAKVTYDEGRYHIWIIDSSTGDWTRIDDDRRPLTTTDLVSADLIKLQKDVFDNIIKLAKKE